MEKIHELTKKDREAINDCIENFNFAQAAEILNFMYDKYTKTSNPDYHLDYENENSSGLGGYGYINCPVKKTTAGQLAIEAKKLLEDCIKEDLYTIQTGWLVVYKYPFEDNSGNKTGYSLFLGFTPVDWDTEVEY